MDATVPFSHKLLFIISVCELMIKKTHVRFWLYFVFYLSYPPCKAYNRQVEHPHR